MTARSARASDGFCAWELLEVVMTVLHAKEDDGYKSRCDEKYQGNCVQTNVEGITSTVPQRCTFHLFANSHDVSGTLCLCRDGRGGVETSEGRNRSWNPRFAIQQKATKRLCIRVFSLTRTSSRDIVVLRRGVELMIDNTRHARR